MNPFFSKRFPIFGTYAILILCVICFLVPVAGRGARMAVISMQNNVADWLPAEYEETQDLAEFRKYFVGDQFVVVSGPWCRAGNQTFTNFVRKLREESLEHEEVLRKNRQDERIRAHQKGDELRLLTTGDYYETWGEHRERWLMGEKGQWYYINRRGELYRWDGQNNIVQGLRRSLERTFQGRNKATGTYIDTFGEEPDDEQGIQNEFYQDPLKLCARPFKSITTGPDIFEKMAGPNGTRRIGLFDETDETSFATKIKTHQLLTGSLFGPTPEPTFRWTYESLLQHVDPQKQVQLKSNKLYRERFEKFVSKILSERYQDDLNQLRQADADTKLEIWYRMWDAIELEAPARQTSIIVTINEPVLRELDRVVGRALLGKAQGRILDLATGVCGISPKNVHIGGPPADNIAIDEEGTITLLRLVNLSMLIGVSLAYVSFRSVRITFLLFFVGGMAAISSLALVWFGGSTLDAILMSMPSLVYVLGLSGAVHVVNYYRDACQETGPKTAAEVAFKHGWFPCGLAAFTTAIGLASLCTSNLVPIQKFGFFSAVATLATVILLFTFLPAALAFWPPGYRRRESDQPEAPSKLSYYISRFWTHVGEWVIRHHVAIVVVFLILIGVFGYGITHVRTSVHLLKLFDADAKILQDYRWLEEHLGKLVPMELVVCIDADSQKEQWLERFRSQDQPESHILDQEAPIDGRSPSRPVLYDEMQYDLKYSMLERMELSFRVRKNVEKFFGPTGLDIVGPGMSTDVFAPIESLDQVDPGKSIETRFKPRAMFQDQLATHRKEMLAEDYLAVSAPAIDSSDERGAGTGSLSGEKEMWRISLRLAALNDVDYGDFVTNLKAVVEPIMKAYEYRTKILRSLQAKLGLDSVTKGRILVLGQNPDRMKGVRWQHPISMANVAELVDQSYIFANTLQDLLENRGFTNKPPKDRPYREKIFRWVDPTVLDTKKITTDDFAKLVKNYDCVVLIEDHPIFDLDVIIQHAGSFVDCRDHKFEIDADKNIPRPGVFTAMQRIKAGEGLDIGTIYTGIIPIVYKAQNQLLISLMNSIAMAFVLIACVMTLLLRNWHQPLRVGNMLNVPGGLVSMIPNVFPIVIVFGAMGFMDIAVDIGSMMTASVAMGVAVDDTIHFLNWYRKALAAGASRVNAIRQAYDRVAMAMTQTTLIGGLGLSAFALSTFTPTQRFGVLMLFLLVAALVGDLILLPALLASPLGRLFGKERRTGNHPSKASTQEDSPLGEFRMRVLSSMDDDFDTEEKPAGWDDDYPDIHPDSLKHLKSRYPEDDMRASGS